MKVRCVRLLDSMGIQVDKSSWATIGKIYDVLSIMIEPGTTRLRLVGDEAGPALFELTMFEIVSSQIPETWIVSSPRQGCLSFGPSAWNRPGFWDDFYNGEPDARSCFERERAMIVLGNQ